MNRPNILIIMIDSLRADHVGCYGYNRPTTPNIDRIAAEGCLFETCITAAPFSPASYASIFSNLYPHQHGVNGDTVRVWPDTWTSLAQTMKSRGYSTFAVSNNAFVSHATNAARGFDRLVETFRRSRPLRMYSALIRRVGHILGGSFADLMEPCYLRWPEIRGTPRAIRHLQGMVHLSQRPFFGVTILMDPHAPYDPRRTEFCGTTRDVKRLLRASNDGTFFARLMASRSVLSESDRSVLIDLYDGSVMHADRYIGRLLDQLRTDALLDETIVVVASDHGEAFGEHGVWGHGFSLTDTLTRVPLIVRAPAYWTAGRRCQKLVQLHDLHDLCLSVSNNGTPSPQTQPHCLTQAESRAWNGRGLAFSHFPVQTGTLRLLHSLDPSFDEGLWGQEMWSVRSDRWRCLQFGDGTVQLFDLLHDPDESHSLHQERADVAANLCAELRRHREEHCVMPLAPKTTHVHDDLTDAVVLERLRSLGYIE